MTELVRDLKNLSKADVALAGGKGASFSFRPGIEPRFFDLLIKLYHPFPKYGWTFHKANLPSLRLLEKFQGGVFEKTVLNKRRLEAEGFFRPSGMISPKMRAALAQLLSEAEIKFKAWQKDYQKRVQELAALNQLLENYASM
ncbi:hypothetical protein COT40_01595 [Candidatus Peregrinibacteria bacterium CG08_land_8_20_14_0_20_41_10]|nr:MAG: hypothetical protein COT40_01595 [Candidatus Peregrinibacteria bacterium CG08_land_8_20_14_0_20_41_10]